MTDTEKVDVWRLRLGKRSPSGAASTGEWPLFESRTELEDALFEAAVENEAQKKPWPMTRRVKWFRLWWKASGGDGKHWRTDAIYHVEHLVDGEWIEVEWSISPPVLTLGGL